MALQSRTQVADFFGVSAFTVLRWAKEPTFPEDIKSTKGKKIFYDTKLLIKWYSEEYGLRSMLNVKDPGKVPKDATDEEITSYADERTRLITAQADHEELKVMERQRMSIPTELVIHAVTSAVTSAKAKLLGLSSKVKSRNPDLPISVITEIDNQVREALEELGGERELPEGLEQHLDEYIQSMDTGTKIESEPVG